MSAMKISVSMLSKLENWPGVGTKIQEFGQMQGERTHASCVYVRG
jgi:hypothetical protein